MIDWNSIQDHFPFLAASAASPGPKLSGTRIIEAVIISGMAALGASYMTVTKLEAKAEFAQRQFDAQVERRNKEIDQIRAQITADALRAQVQYEAVRIELQRLALSIERDSKARAR